MSTQLTKDSTHVSRILGESGQKSTHIKIYKKNLTKSEFQSTLTAIL